MREEPDNLGGRDGGLDAPDALVRGLQQRKTPPVRVPPEVDRAILRSAHEHLAAVAARAGSPPAKLIPFPGLWVRFAAAAAVVLLAAVLWFRPAPETGIALDQPTVIDAFRLARQVDAGESLPGKFDLNGDGTVDANDAQLLAQRAVTLPEGGAL